jgi:hypothetical protein
MRPPRAAMETDAVVKTDNSAESVYMAGQTVPPGIYCLMEGDREVRLDQEGVLPATCDGHVAVYRRRPETWGERQNGETHAGRC